MVVMSENSRLGSFLTDTVCKLLMDLKCELCNANSCTIHCSSFIIWCTGHLAQGKAALTGERAWLRTAWRPGWGLRHHRLTCGGRDSTVFLWAGLGDVITIALPCNTSKINPFLAETLSYKMHQMGSTISIRIPSLVPRLSTHISNSGKPGNEATEFHEKVNMSLCLCGKCVIRTR